MPLFQGIRGVRRDWIDHAVPAAADVAVLWTNRSDRFTVNQNEFFNRRVGPGLLHRRPDAGRRRRGAGLGRPRRRAPCGSTTASAVKPGYLLTDDSVEPDAMPVARDQLLGMTLWRVPGPLVLAKTTVRGHLPERHVVGPAGDAGPASTAVAARSR